MKMMRLIDALQVFQITMNTVTFFVTFLKIIRRIVVFKLNFKFKLII